MVEGDSISLSAAAEGRPPLHYSWRRNGLEMQQQQAAEMVAAEAALSDAGSYFCRISNPW